MVDAKKPSNTEEEYFAREEAEKLYRMHKEKIKEIDTAKMTTEKAAHWMKCGKCGYDLQTITWRKVEIDKCFRCGVVLLDDGELEKLAGQENASELLGSFLGIFKK
jgi:uncharacterized protein